MARSMDILAFGKTAAFRVTIGGAFVISAGRRAAYGPFSQINIGSASTSRSTSST